MEPFLRGLGLRSRVCANSPTLRWIAVLTLGLGVVAVHLGKMAPIVAAASYQTSTNNKPKEFPPREPVPKELPATAETNKQALQLTIAVFEARLRRGEVEFKFRPKVAPPDKNDPLSGPNDLAVSPLLQDFGQGAVWLSVILSVNPSDLSPRLQEVQRVLLEGLQQAHSVKPKELNKQIRTSNRSKDLEQGDVARDVERVLQAERNYQAVVAQLRAAFPMYAELYQHQSPRVLNRPGVPTVFELCDPVISADPLEKNERMQASLMVKVYRYDEHSFKIVSFWLYRKIEDPASYVPRELYSEKGRDATRNIYGRWDDTHMPPRTFSSVAYVSPAVTVLTLEFVDGEPIISGRSVPPGRRRAQPVDLAVLDLNQLNPSTYGVLDVSVPSFPVSMPEIPHTALALKYPRLGVDYMPRIRESYEFRTQAEYEGYLTGIREALVVERQTTEIREVSSSTKAEPTMAAAAPAREPPVGATPKAASAQIAPVYVQQLNAVYLDPQQPSGLNGLSTLARGSLSQFADLRPVPSRYLANLLVEKSNASLRNHDRAAELLQQKLLKVREVNLYFLASENTNASWRGLDDSSGKGGIVVILPNRYYFDSHQFYGNAASALLNEPVTTEDVATISSYLGGAAAQPAVATKQFAIATDFVDHGWDEDGAMRRWVDEVVDFFKHLREAITYLKPRLESMAPDKRAMLEREIPVVEGWLNSLGDEGVTVNFGLYKGKNEAPPPKVDTGTRTIWISCIADEYIKSEQKEYRWPLLAKIVEGFNGLQGGKFDPGIAGAVYDILTAYATDKDNKLMIAWRLNSDMPVKPPDWPTLSGVSLNKMAVQPPQVESRSVTATGVPPVARGIDPIAKEPAPQVASQPVKQQSSETAQEPPSQSVVASAKAAPPVPQLEERRPKAVQPVRTPGAQWADPAFGKQVTALIGTHMNGVDESSLHGIVLRTMKDRLIIVRDPNPNFHSKVSALVLKEPSPDQFDLTVNKTEYFDALFTLGEKDKAAYDVIWSTLEANLATVEYAAGNPDFGSFYTTMQSDLSSAVKRHTNGSVVTQEIFEDPEFKALLPYYTTFWSNWQFAGERARFEYLHKQVTSKRLRQLGEEAGNRTETKAVKADLLRLAEEVDLFYGDVVQAVNPLRAEDSNAPQSPTSLNTARLAQLSSGNFAHVYDAPVRPWDMKDYNMNQVIAAVQKVEQPSAQHGQYQETYRRAYTIRLLLDAWGRTEPDKQKKLLVGDWTGADMRFILAILTEIQAKRIGNEVNGETIVRLSKDMPWIGDPAFDVSQGAFGKLPDNLKLKP